MNVAVIKTFGFYKGKEVSSIILETSLLKVEILNFGCILHSIILKEALNHDAIVSPKTLDGYINQFNGVPYYFGATIGRYAGRISNGSFTLHGKKYNLNSTGETHLHGGENGLYNRMWKIEGIQSKPFPMVTLSCDSPDMDQGYPGHVKVLASFSLEQNNALDVSYTAVSSKDTVLNLTNHAYFNLGMDSIENHFLQISSKKILACDANLIPSGKKITIENTPYDFTKLSPMHQLNKINGLDTTFCYENTSYEKPKVIYFAPSTRIEMKVSSNQNCAVIFAPKQINFEEQSKDKRGSNLHFPAICFEMQNYPDAPNRTSFPSSLLKKGESYKNKMVFEFGLRKE